MEQFKSAADLAIPDKPVDLNWFNKSGLELTKSAIGKKQYEGQLRRQNIGIVDEPYLKEGSMAADVGFFRDSDSMKGSIQQLPSTTDVTTTTGATAPTQQLMGIRRDTLPGGGDLPTGYIPDADPRMVKRRAEAGQVHQQRLQNITQMQQDSTNLPRGQFATMGQESAEGRARQQMYSGGGGGQLPRGNADFQRRHAGEQYARETARMRVQGNQALGVQELAQRTQAAQVQAGQHAAGLQSAERIAGAKAGQSAAEVKRKAGIKEKERQADPKNTWNKIQMDNDLWTMFNSVNLNDPNSIATFDANSDISYAQVARLKQQYGKQNEDVLPPARG